MLFYDKNYLLIQGFEEFQPPSEKPEGILNQRDEEGNLLEEGALSVTEVEVLDLIGEGELDGLVSGRYVYSGTYANVGWDKVDFYPYSGAPGTTIDYLRSIYWNETPVVNSEDKYNFQNINVSYTRGFPNGSIIDQLQPELTVSRAISERLRGSVIDPENENLTVLAPSEDFAKIYTILNKECKAVIVNVRIHSLSSTNTTKKNIGDIETSTIEYVVYYKPLFSTVGKTPNEYILGKREIVTGKVSSPYIKSSRVEFFKNEAGEDSILGWDDFLGWEIKVIRITADSTTTNIRNQTSIDSITEVYGNVYTYPNSAIVRQKFNAEYFSKIPDRIFDTKLLKVKIPNNYNPINKTYGDSRNGNPEVAVNQGADYWDGNFKDEKQWTDNPAWCYYDILVNKRYGLGKYIEQDQVDKWSLYEIAKHCDTLVSDGFGNLEPQFTCNVLINSREEAYKVINDMAGIFRGASYYGGGSIFAIQDRKKSDDEIITFFSNSNVENGEFTYSSTRKKDRHSIAVVRYNDKTNFYRPAIEYVEDIEAIRKYGIRELDMTAFGCSSRGQAVRLGKSFLLSETMETETIQFTAGLEGAYLKPGDVFKVHDLNKKTKRYAGRIYRIQADSINQIFTLDDEVALQTGTIYDFSVVTPTYNYDPVNVSDLNSTDYANTVRSHIQTKSFTGIMATGVTGDGVGRTSINFYDLFNTTDYILTGNSLWTIELPSGVTNYNENQSFIDKTVDYFKVNNISEKESFKFEVNGRKYDERKYDLIVTGLTFGTRTEYRELVPATPTNLQLNYESGTNTIDYSFVAKDITNVAAWKVYGKLNTFNDTTTSALTGYLVNTLPLEINDGAYTPAYEGRYYFRVYGFSETKTFSTGYASGDISVSRRVPIQNIIISSLGFQLDTGNAAGIRNTGGYVGHEPTFVWQVGASEKAPLSTENNFRFSVRSPSSTNVPTSTIYYANSGINFLQPTYTFGMEKNISSVGGPFREYDVVVEAIDISGRTSAGNLITGSLVQENWSRPEGYDIFYVNNPRVTGIYLSSGARNYPNWVTTQAIDTDGNIKLTFVSGELLQDDIAGAFMYFSKRYITGLDAVTGLAGAKPGAPDVTIYNSLYNSQSKTFNAPMQLRTTPSGYMFMGFYDTFDNYFIENKIWSNNWTGMTTGAMTNTTAVFQSGSSTMFSFNDTVGQLVLEPVIGTDGKRGLGHRTRGGGGGGGGAGDLILIGKYQLN